MTRTLKIRTVTIVDMEIPAPTGLSSGPLSPQQRKELQKQITADARRNAAGHNVVDVSIKRAFVVND